MRSLYLRIWLTVVTALALFALVSGWLVQRHIERERVRAESSFNEQLSAWGELLQRSLPAADAPVAVQAEGLRDWSFRLRVPMALDDADGRRIGASDSFERRQADAPPALRRALPIRFDDGRTLWAMRPRMMRLPHGPPDAEAVPGEARGPHADRRDRPPARGPLDWPGVPDGLVLLLLLALLFAAVAAGAWPVVRRLTRRLEALQRGVEAFGAGALHQRVAEDGRDEVASLAASFNRAATRIEALLRSHQSLLANASHELRSPLARLKVALAMLDDAAPAQRAALQTEIGTNIAELDALVEEVLLASRIDAAAAGSLVREPVDLQALLAEEAARVDVEVDGESVTVDGDERLLRRAFRNLLDNARRYGGAGIEARVRRDGALARIGVCDRGPGVPASYRDRIFEPFFRLPGHAEQEGGVGLGLSLVRQIAERHGGQVACRARDGGGSCFELSLPLKPA